MNGMPMPGAMPAAPQGQPMPQQQPQGSAAGMIPAGLEAQIDPRNPVQALLLKRLDSLGEQEVQALMTGIEPEAALALKRILPELGFLIDHLMQQGGGEQDYSGGMDDEEQPMPQQAQHGGFGLARSRLASV